MAYLIPIVIVVLAIAGFVIFMVFRAVDKGASSGTDGADGGAPGVGSDDQTPLGDTSEHAGEQTEAGTTVAGQDADEHGGTGRPVHSGAAETTGAGHDPSDPDAAAHTARPGEGEGSEALNFHGEHPPGSRGGG
jgi:hypothetical protein